MSLYQPLVQLFLLPTWSDKSNQDRPVGGGVTAMIAKPARAVNVRFDD
jgi:hypothetical protein